MREIELKIELDAAQARRLGSSAALKSLAVGRAETRTLWSIYFDTDDHRLRARGIALRLRRCNGRWVQTLKQATAAIEGGLSQPREFEYPVDGRKLDLTRIPDDDLREDVIGIAKHGLHPVAQTRFRRSVQVLQLPNAARIELCIDKGSVSCGDDSAGLTEAEFELLAGAPCDLYDAAETVIPKGPIRFSTTSKSERALALSTPPQGELPTLRKARPVDLTQAATVEEAARMIFAEGVGHAVPNIARIIDCDDVHGPHQLRVGLRRLRSAFSAFRPAIGRGGLDRPAEAARKIGEIAGRLRDLDVLAEEIIASAAADQPPELGFDALRSAVEERRRAVRRDVRTALIGVEATSFAFMMGRFLAGRDWLETSDESQTARLAGPVPAFARRVLNKRWRGVRTWGDRIEHLTILERHEMRKELKKLRYVLDGFKSLQDDGCFLTFMRQLKRLQKAFGALNDAAMAEAMLCQADPPGADDPMAQRAAGWIMGHLQARSDQLWPAAIDDWHVLVKMGPFWR